MRVTAFLNSTGSARRIIEERAFSLMRERSANDVWSSFIATQAAKQAPLTHGQPDAPIHAFYWQRQRGAPGYLTR
jgi:hypothetical protein